MQSMIRGRAIEDWLRDYPLLEDVISTREVLWLNSSDTRDAAQPRTNLDPKDIELAEQRLQRFAPYLAEVFPETRNTKGIIESALVKIPKMKKELERLSTQEIEGSLYVKCDSHLPIAGSIKARGGIYEVLKVAEDLALKNKLLTVNDDYTEFASERFRQLFSRYSIVVGSTGNLGLSIGIMSAQLGFKVTVHMSADAKQWKKDMLRAKGVNVVEHNSDFTQAVEAGRRQSELDPNSHFIDDENSKDLFLGYAVAAARLKKQLDEMNILVDEQHPLFVYLPCGVGGGPGGITYGLKVMFKDHVHCFFAEPTHSPAMLLGLMTKLHDQICVQDFGIDNTTEADGLAVGRPSGFVGKNIGDSISGVYTVNDDQLYVLLTTLADSEDIYLEPSALAGFVGPVKLFTDSKGQKYLQDKNLREQMNNATHIVWATGGSMVPLDIMKNFYNKGLTLSKLNSGRSQGL